MRATMSGLGVYAVAGELRMGRFLSLSFQRFPRPAHGVLEADPRSFGLLPIARARTGDFLVPLRDDEALWIGLHGRSLRRRVLVVVSVEVALGELLDAATGARAYRDSSVVI